MDTSAQGQRGAPFASCARMMLPPQDEFSKCLDYLSTMDLETARDHCISQRGDFQEGIGCGREGRIGSCSVVENQILAAELVDVRYIANFYSGTCEIDFLTEWHCGMEVERVECDEGALNPPALPRPGPSAPLLNSSRHLSIQSSG